MDPRFERFHTTGHTVLVASVDVRSLPSVCRGVAVTSGDGYETLTVFVPLATSQEVVASVAATHRLAVTVTDPPSHASTQFKGTVATVRLARDEEAPLVRAQLERTAEALETLGLPRRVIRSVAHWPSFAIEMRVDEIFEQTPGPRAGARLR